MKNTYMSRVAAFRSFSVGDIRIRKKQISGRVSISHKDGMEENFRLIFSYSEEIEADLNTAGLMLTMPLINFTYFSEKLILDYPVSGQDRILLEKFLKINAREVFVNKICRRRYEFFLQEAIPSKKEITEENADGRTELVTTSTFEDTCAVISHSSSALILSSGGKESLLTFGMMKDLNPRTHAYFFNESGGHWRAAKTSYDYFRANYKGVSKVWSNVDRFYRFMLERLPVLNMETVKKRADTYPVQLFIFPVYIFAAIPLVRKHNIGNILMGNEFDDPKDMPLYRGIRHYFGVFDQSSDFMEMMTGYFQGKGISTRLWSAVYPISGTVVEDILVKRYRNLFLQQRSCHSCRYEEGAIRPCGSCTKCLGVAMFVLAAGGSPEEILYDRTSISDLERNVNESRMRLDPDELSYLKNVLWGHPDKGNADHVRGIHILPGESEPLLQIPEDFRRGIGLIYEQYCKGYYRLDGEHWEKAIIQKYES
ncbi:MAG TPA: metal-binding protein [Thermoplasmataceae archaeon]|nr:metal-binding protein [Thermoplasmataceae archaeon]